VRKRRKIIRWAEPPALTPEQLAASDHRKGGSRGSQWDDVADALRGEPGKSAVIASGNRNTISAIAEKVRSGTLACFRPAGAFTTTRRTVHTPAGPVVDLYARFVGEVEP
jgi:hypothetical protein